MMPILGSVPKGIPLFLSEAASVSKAFPDLPDVCYGCDHGAKYPQVKIFGKPEQSADLRGKEHIIELKP